MCHQALVIYRKGNRIIKCIVESYQMPSSILIRSPIIPGTQVNIPMEVCNQACPATSSWTSSARRRRRVLMQAFWPKTISLWWDRLSKIRREMQRLQLIMKVVIIVNSDKRNMDALKQAPPVAAKTQWTGTQQQCNQGFALVRTVLGAILDSRAIGRLTPANSNTNKWTRARACRSRMRHG